MIDVAPESGAGFPIVIPEAACGYPGPHKTQPAFSTIPARASLGRDDEGARSQPPFSGSSDMPA
jgi:hypothetical protein